MDGPTAEATRRKFYDMLVAEKMLVQGFHYPFPSLGHIEGRHGDYRVVPVPGARPSDFALPLNRWKAILTDGLLFCPTSSR